LRRHQLSSREIVSEAIANALDHNGSDKPEKLAIEPWLYRLSLRAIHELAHNSGDGVESVHLEDLPRGRESNLGQGSDEPLLQFHQPDESMTEENMIPNRGVATPEESAASDEMVRMIELALLGTKVEDREAFLLYGIEGFTVEEISIISSRPGDAVRGSIQSAREHLRKYLPAPVPLKNKLLQNTKIA
jgi:DNA-directed RNA polymerase specialized sigma24 family protein